MLSKAIAMIEEQQKRADKRSHIFMIGEQLKDICRTEPSAAALVANDLENESMGLNQVKEKFDAFADAHKSGKQAIITPAEADELIRKFYGIPIREIGAPEQQKATKKVISMFDFL